MRKNHNARHAARRRATGRHRGHARGLGQLGVVLALTMLGGVFSSAGAAVQSSPSSDDVSVHAPAPTFIDPTCESPMRGFDRPDAPESGEPAPGVSYDVLETELEGTAIRYLVTVEALDGYQITSYGPGFDASAGGWVHEYPPFPDCPPEVPQAEDPTPIVVDDPGPLPDTGASTSLLVIGLVLVAVGVVAVVASKRGRR